MAGALVVAEHLDGTLRRSTLAALSAAQAYCALAGGEADAIVLGAECEGVAREAALHGVRRVLLAESPALAHALAQPVASAVAQAARDGGYGAVLAPATTFGKDFMPRLSGLLDAPMASDVVGLSLESGALRVRRPMYAGNAIATVSMSGGPLLLTVRTTAFAAAPGAGPPAPVVPFTPDVDAGAVRFVGRAGSPSTRPELTEARVVVSGGRGLKSAGGFALVERLADRLGAAVGASRAAVDAGWVGNDRQVGQTGKVVAPELYVALGISGAIQHLAGMKDSKIIVAIDRDPEAPIFKVADYGLVADLFQAVPGILEAIDKLPPR